MTPSKLEHQGLDPLTGLLLVSGNDPADFKETASLGIWPRSSLHPSPKDSEVMSNSHAAHLALLNQCKEWGRPTPSNQHPQRAYQPRLKVINAYPVLLSLSKSICKNCMKSKALPELLSGSMSKDLCECYEAYQLTLQSLVLEGCNGS